ncbi:MAG TPA: ferritin-like domain-containing protein [Streptosporangiaceae bacterium]
MTALQALLAAENAAVYGYGLAGAQLSGSLLTAAQQDWNLHRAAQATVSAMVVQRGGTPAPAAAAYRPPFAVTSTATARSLAALLEDGLVQAYLGLVALTDQDLRAFGAGQMQAAAVRASFWRGGTTAFPGLPASALG